MVSDQDWSPRVRRVEGIGRERLQVASRLPYNLLRHAHRLLGTQRFELLAEQVAHQLVQRRGRDLEHPGPSVVGIHPVPLAPPALCSTSGLPEMPASPSSSPQGSTVRRRPKIYYGYYLVGAAFIAQMISCKNASASPSVAASHSRAARLTGRPM